MSILAHTLHRPMIQPRWQAPLGVMESVVAYNCRKHGMPVPVLAMPFWEGAGNKAYDVSGNGNHGTLTNGAKWVGGKFGNAISFDGTNDFINIPDADSLDAITQLTVLAWIKQPVLAANKAIIAKWDYQTQGSWDFQTTNTTDELRVFVADSLTDAGTNYGDTTTLNMVAGNWYHIAFVYNGSGVTNADRLKIYVNGISQGLTFGGIIPVSLQNSTASVKVGNFGGSLARYFNGIIDSPRIYDHALTAVQVKFEYDNPFWVYEMPEELWGYVAAGGQIYSVTLPDNFLLSDTPKKIKEQQVTEILSALFDTSWKIKEQQITEPLNILSDGLKSSAEFPRVFQDNFSNLNEQIYKTLNKTFVESILASSDILTKSLEKKQIESLQTLQDSSRKSESKICSDIIPNLSEQIYKTLNKIFVESIPVLSDAFQTLVAGIIVKLLTDNFLLSDQLTKLLEKKQTEFLQTPQDALETERFFYQKLLDALQTLQDNSRKAESKTSADIFTNIQDQSSKILLLSALDNINVSDVMRKEEFKFFIESVVLSDTLIKQIAKLLSEQLNISDAYSIEVAVQIIEKLLTDSIRLNDLYKLNQNKSITDSFTNLSDTFAAEIVKLAAIVLYMLTDIKDLIGRDTDIKDLIGRDTDIKGH